MSDLGDLVEGLKRELAVPGEFAGSFPSTTDDDLAGALADGFAAAQLDGWFKDQVVDPGLFSVTPDLSAPGGALVILYATERILLSKLRDLNSRTLYKAGNVEYEVDKSASLMTEQMKYLRQRRQDMLAAALRMGRAGRSIYMQDAYLTRDLEGVYGGIYGTPYYTYELIGLG